MNVELLQQIKARILAEPDAFRMDTWSCGTAHCIAGWACALVGDPVDATAHSLPMYQTTASGRYPPEVAAEALELGPYVRDDICLSDSLFMDSEWPDEFLDAFVEVEDIHTPEARRQRAEIAAARIDHFIATNGAE